MFLSQRGMKNKAWQLTHNARSPVVSLHVLHKLVPVDALDVVHWTQDGATQGTVLEGCGVQVVKHKLGVLLVDLEAKPRELCMSRV